MAVLMLAVLLCAASAAPARADTYFSTVNVNNGLRTQTVWVTVYYSALLGVERILTSYCVEANKTSDRFFTDEITRVRGQVQNGGCNGPVLSDISDAFSYYNVNRHTGGKLYIQWYPDGKAIGHSVQSYPDI